MCMPAIELVEPSCVANKAQTTARAAPAGRILDTTMGQRRGADVRRNVREEPCLRRTDRPAASGCTAGMPWRLPPAVVAPAAAPAAATDLSPAPPLSTPCRQSTCRSCWPLPARSAAPATVCGRCGRPAARWSVDAPLPQEPRPPAACSKQPILCCQARSPSASICLQLQLVCTSTDAGCRASYCDCPNAGALALSERSNSANSLRLARG